MLAGVLEVSRLEHEQAGGLDLRGHVGELELDRLVVGDLLAERLSLLGVAQGELEGSLGHADAARLAGPTPGTPKRGTRSWGRRSRRGIAERRQSPGSQRTSPESSLRPAAVMKSYSARPGRSSSRSAASSWSLPKASRESSRNR